MVTVWVTPHRLAELPVNSGRRKAVLEPSSVPERPGAQHSPILTGIAPARCRLVETQLWRWRQHDGQMQQIVGRARCLDGPILTAVYVSEKRVIT